MVSHAAHGKPPRPWSGFSLVEVVLSMALISIMTAVSIGFYDQYAARVKEENARAKLAIIGQAVARWQLENNRTYPYGDLTPLKGTRLENLEVDPWMSEYRIVPSDGLVYSLGPNRTDDRTGGDDIVTKYGVVQESIPLSPRALTGRLSVGGVRLDWKPPTGNIDGTPLATGLGTWEYEVARSSRDLPFELAPDRPAPFGPKVAFKAGSRGVSWTATVGWATAFLDDALGGLDRKYTYYYSVRAKRTNVTARIVRSGFSNEVGIFVPQRTEPQISRFQPTANPVPLGKPFAFDIDVIDPSAGLCKVSLDFNGATREWTRGAGGITNPFRFAMTYSPTNLPAGPTTVNGSRLTVQGGQNPQSGGSCAFTTSAAVDSIVFINRRPVVTALRPAFSSFAVTPGATRNVDFVVETRDDDGNLTEVRIADGIHPDENFSEPRVFSAVERVSWSYSLATTRTIVVSATAVDAIGDSSPPANGIISIAADITPPVTPVVDASSSNMIMATDTTILTTWTVPKDGRFKIHWEAFDPETPPVAYRALIATTDPIATTTAALSTAITQDSNTRLSGWTSPVTTQDYEITYKTDGSGDLRAPLVEALPYFIAIKAQNRGGIANPRLVAPKNRRTGLLQSPFVVDKTPPRVDRFTLDSTCDPEIKPLAGRPVLSPPVPVAYKPVFTRAGVASASWVVADYNPANQIISSNPNDFLVQYDIYQILDTADNRNRLGTEPLWLGERVGGNSVKATRFSVRLPTQTPALANRSRLNVRFKARDVAGNWSIPTTRTAVIDAFGPTAVGPPQIVARGGVTNNPREVTMDFTTPTTAGRVTMFTDSESGTDAIRDAWRWEIAIAGAVRGSEEIRAFGTVQRFPQDIAVMSPPLNNGDLVFLRVTATDCVGNLSLPTTSALVRVDTSLQPRIIPCPSRTFFKRSVSLTCDVTGGGPFYTFLLAPNVALDAGSQLDMPASCLRLGANQEPTRSNVTTHTCLFTFDRAGDVSDRVEARVTVQSYPDAFSAIVAPPFQASTILSVLPVPLALVASRSTGRIELADLADTSSSGSSPLLTFTVDSGQTPVGLAIDPREERRYFLALTSGGGGTAVSRVYRFDLATGARSIQHESAAGEIYRHFDLATDGSFAIVTVDEPSSRRHYTRLTFPSADGFKSATLDFGSAGGTLSGIAIAPNGSFALAVVTSDRTVEKITSPSLASPAVALLATMPAGLSPDLVTIAPSGAIAAIGPSAGTDIALVNTGGGSVSTLPIPAPAPQAPVRGISVSSDSAFAYVALPDRVARIAIGDGSALQGASLAANDLGPLALAFNDSFAVVSNSAGPSVQMRQVTPDATCGGLPRDGSSFGVVLGQAVNVSSQPGPLRLMDRANRGKPALYQASPATVSINGDLELRGLNLGPVATLRITVGGRGAERKPGSAFANGFNRVTVTVPPGTPTGPDVEVVAGNEFGDGTATVRVTVNP